MSRPFGPLIGPIILPVHLAIEQVLPAASGLAELLMAAPGVTLLATSREALRLRREQTFHVPPLALPDPQHLPRLEELSQIPSLALFLQRAQAIDPDFALTEDNAGRWPSSAYTSTACRWPLSWRRLGPPSCLRT
jgi:hypothetical protein